MVYAFDHGKQIGCVIDPIKTVYAHFVEIFHKDVDVVSFRAFQQRHKEFFIFLEGFFGGKPTGITAMHDKIRNAPRTASIDAAERILEQNTAVCQGLAHRGMGLDQADIQCFGRVLDFFKIVLIIRGINTAFQIEVATEVIICIAKTCFADVFE